MGADPVIRTALFGGSFNPVHWGHIRPVIAAKRQFGLHHVIYLPAAQPLHKAGMELEDPFHRFACLARCLAPYPDLILSSYELHRPACATVETLAHFRHQLPGDLFFILGSDSLLQLPTWREPERILDLASLIVLMRPGAAINPNDLPPYLAREWGRRIHPCHHRPVRISSTALRQALAAGEVPWGRMPSAAVQYIRTHHLYQEA